jgi:DNA-binding response OmpR family regulator
MELLMQTPNVIIPQEKLLEKIWGQDTENVQNVVWVYVSYLRKKLISLGADVQINSHRNVGYSLEGKTD